MVLLRIDGLESSALHLSDPAVLDFEYMELMSRVLDAVRPAGPVRALHLGGAGCALPRAWAARRPGSRQLVAEVDPDLARLAREWFDLPRSPEVRIRVGDAREVVRAQRPGSWEVVVRDTFAGGLVPAHLATVEFVAEVRDALVPGGLYLVNVAEGAPLRATRAELRALGEAFATVALVTDPAILSGRRHGNLVLAASDSPLPAADLDRAVRTFPLPVRVRGDAGARALARGATAPRDPVARDPVAHDPVVRGADAGPGAARGRGGASATAAPGGRAGQEAGVPPPGGASSAGPTSDGPSSAGPPPVGAPDGPPAGSLSGTPGTAPGPAAEY